LKVAICVTRSVAIDPYGSPAFASFTHAVRSAVGSAPSGGVYPSVPPAASALSTLVLTTPTGLMLSGFVGSV
jgi:hypothetical protein